MSLQRIALVMHGPPSARLAGVELYVARLARCFRDMGMDFDIVYPDFDLAREPGEIMETRFEGIPAFGVGVALEDGLDKRYRNTRVAADLVDLLQKREIGLAHFHHLLGFTGAGLNAAGKAGIKTVVTTHDCWSVCPQVNLLRHDGTICPGGPQDDELCATCLLQRRPELAASMETGVAARLLTGRRTYLMQTMNKADMVLTPSRYMADLFTGQGLNPDLITHSPLGLSPLADIPEKQPREAGLHLGYFGNFGFVKGIDLLIEAMDMLAGHPVTLDLYGGDIVSRFGHEVSSLVADRVSINLHGSYQPEELPGLLASVDVALLPSRMESYSFVARECLQMGVPVIAADVAALPEIILHGETGWLFPPGNSSALAETIFHVMAHPEALNGLNMSKIALETSTEEARRLLGYYAGLLEKS